MHSIEQEQASAGALQVLILEAAGQRYAVDLLSVREVRRWTRVVRLPHADPCVLGVMNVRGAVVPVIELARRLGERGEASGHLPTCVSVLLHAQLAGAQRTVGIRVDGVADVVDLLVDDLRPPPAERGQTDLVAGLFTFEHDTVVLLSVEELLVGLLPLDGVE